MSNADFTRLSFVEESTFAVAVVTPALLELNITDCDFRMVPGKAPSRIIRPDAQAIRGTKVSESALGPARGELQYDITGAFFKLLKSSMRSAAETAATTTITGVSATGAVLSGTGVHTGMEVGDIVRVRTSADVLVGYFGVTLVGVDTITLDGSPTVTSGLKVRRGVRIKNATTFKSFNVEESHPDVSPELHEVLFGMLPGRFSTQVQIDQPTTWQFDFVGSHSDKITNTQISEGSRTPGPTTGVVKSTLPKIYIDGQTFCATNIQAGWNLNAQAKRCLDTNRAKSIRTGKFTAAGSATVYLEDKTLYQSAINDTESRLFYVQNDATELVAGDGGNAIAFAFGNIQWGEPTKPVTGENSDVFLTLPWTAAVDSVELVTARVIFFPVAN